MSEKGLNLKVGVVAERDWLRWRGSAEDVQRHNRRLRQRRRCAAEDVQR